MPDIETLFDIVPGKYMTDNLSDFVSVFQDVLDDLMEDIDDFVDIIDPDKCDEQYLDAMFYEMGFDLWEDIHLSVTQKRKLVKALISLYSQKGTESGVKNAIWFLLGLNVTYVRPFRDSAWTLDVSEVDVNAELSPDTKPHKYHYTIQIHVDYEVGQPHLDSKDMIDPETTLNESHQFDETQSMTQLFTYILGINSYEIEALLIKILEFMTEKHMRWEIITPEDQDSLASWTLGVSRLGWNFETVLSE